MSRSVRDKRALVTGGAGFIGSHLVDALIAAGVADVTVVDNFFLGKERNLDASRRASQALRVVRADASDTDAMRKILNQTPPIDIVFDLAVIPLPTSLERPQFCFDMNVRITSTFCELLREGRYETLVHFSSSEAYGSARTAPMSEAHPLEPLTPYAASKAASDHLVRTYAATFGVDALVVRPFNNYGPRQNDQQYAGVIPSLLVSAFTNQPFSLFGDGLQTRDYIYVTDTVRAAIALYECPAARGQVINVASGREIRIIDLIDKLEVISGRTVQIERLPPRPGDVRQHVADITFLQELIGFEPQVEIEEGLEKTVAYYRAVYGGETGGKSQ
jgi:UDP-glucose 4-epimerase